MTPSTDIFKVKQPHGLSRHAVTAWPGIMLESATTLLLLSACVSAPTPPTAALETGLLLATLASYPESPAEHVGKNIDNTADSVVDQIGRTSNGLNTGPETEVQHTRYYF